MILPPPLTEGKLLSRRPGAAAYTVDAHWEKHLPNDCYCLIIYSFSTTTAEQNLTVLVSVCPALRLKTLHFCLQFLKTFFFFSNNIIYIVGRVCALFVNPLFSNTLQTDLITDRMHVNFRLMMAIEGLL